MGSVVVGHRLSCSAALRDLPGPGIELVSPALQGRLLTKGPPFVPISLDFVVWVWNFAKRSAVSSRSCDSEDERGLDIFRLEFGLK